MNKKNNSKKTPKEGEKRKPVCLTSEKKKPSLEEELTQVLNEVKQETTQSLNVKENINAITIDENGQVSINNHLYGLVYNHREGFDLETFQERYSDVLHRYDYIVGDWGFEQLRLRGFFDNDNKRAFADQKIATLQDYLYEYCNFGCRYFVLEKVEKKKEKPFRPKKTKKQLEGKDKGEKQSASFTQGSKKNKGRKNKKNEKSEGKTIQHTSSFTIRKREE